MATAPGQKVTVLLMSTCPLLQWLLCVLLQLTARSHLHVWRKHLTRWRGLLHQKFHLLEVRWPAFAFSGMQQCCLWLVTTSLLPCQLDRYSSAVGSWLMVSVLLFGAAGHCHTAEQHGQALCTLLEGLGRQQG
jgi:hypothetical protein